MRAPLAALVALALAGGCSDSDPGSRAGVSVERPAGAPSVGPGPAAADGPGVGRDATASGDGTTPIAARATTRPDAHAKLESFSAAALEDADPESGGSADPPGPPGIAPPGGSEDTEGQDTPGAASPAAPAPDPASDLEEPVLPGSAAAVKEDERIARRIAQRIAWDQELAPYDIRVNVNDAVVNLTGTVGTPTESHRARRIAEDSVDLSGVVNGLAVDPALVPVARSPVERPDDATLAERVEAVLKNDPGVTANAIEVQVQDGEVTLEGPVPELAQRLRAERIVRLLNGVQLVANHLWLEEPAPAPGPEGANGASGSARAN